MNAMVRIASGLLVFLGGFAVMVLEIVGARYLAKDFGSSLYVWTSQIGVVLIALALGYTIGGVLADRFRRPGPLAVPLGLAGVGTFFIPEFTPPLLEAIVMRHPLNQPIPMVWQKLDPAFGSTLVFFLPCLVLATLSPYVTRLAARRVERIGIISGLVYAASTVGSIAGVFVSGYLLVDSMQVPAIFRATGILICLLGVWSLALDRWMARGVQNGDQKLAESRETSGPIG